jgi:hypothetical protein
MDIRHRLARSLWWGRRVRAVDLLRHAQEDAQPARQLFRLDQALPENVRTGDEL